METKTITCITCPIGCDIVVEGEGETIVSLKGAVCKRGETYATNEFIHPVRILTSLAKVEGADVPLVPIRSNAPVPKELQFQCMDAIRTVTLSKPVNAGDVVVKDICGTGVDMVATGSVL